MSYAGPARKAIVSVGRELYRQGLIAGGAGNISVRLEDGRILVTPRAAHKGRLEPPDLVTVTVDEAPGPRASSELEVHLACYRADPGIGAVIHTHAPGLTAAGVREAHPADLLPEIEAAVGPLRTVPFLPSGGTELAAAVGEQVAAGATVVLMQRHGVVAVGSTLRQAQDRMELAELAARTVLLAGG